MIPPQAARADIDGELTERLLSGFTNDERVGLRGLANVGIIIQHGKRWVVIDLVRLPYLTSLRQTRKP